jgi:DNA-binding transcriptional MerR regulator
MTEPQIESASTTGLYRIGAVAKMVGVPVATLRVWERRYAVVTPPKTEGGQRLYSDADLLKITMLKNLTMQGHAISTLSQMDHAQLQRLLNDSRAAQSATSAPRALPAAVSLAVVGLGLARRLETDRFNSLFQQTRLKVSQVHADLKQALEQAVGLETPDVLLVQMGAVQAGVCQDLVRLREQFGVRKMLLVYHFATEHALQALRAAGVMARREPVSDSDLSDIIHSVLLVETGLKLSGSATITPRKYSDQVLLRVAGISTQVLCECPKHVADLIFQLNSFEQYSRDCLSNSVEDASLHAYLTAVSGSARALFEEALERIATHEQIDLREGA